MDLKITTRAIDVPMPSPCGVPVEDEEKNFGAFQCWSTGDGTHYFPSGRMEPTLPEGVYELKFDYSRGIYFEKINVKTEGLIRFPDTNSEFIIDEIRVFWEAEAQYRQQGIAYKRGLLLYGPPGSGKSSTLQLVISDVVDRGGIVIKYNIDVNLFMDGLRALRAIQPTTPVVILFEDIDSIIQKYSESDLLNIIDGVDAIDKVIFIATTNYPECLGDRIVNRPSRFDRRFKMGHPNKPSRKIYLKSMITQDMIEKFAIDIDRWVADTQDYSIAHLKELFVSVCILGQPYKKVTERLRSMMEDKITSFESNMGFQN